MIRRRIPIPGTWPSLIRLAWPAVTTGVVRIAMRTVDLIVVGLVVGAVGVAAVGIADAAARLVLMTALGLSAGTMATVSQRYGAGQHRAASAAVTQTALIAVVLGTIATVTGIALAEPYFVVLGAEPAVVEAGSIYLTVIIATAVPRELAIMLSRAFQAAGDTFSPMVVRVTATTINIALTIVLVPGLGPFPELGVLGAAMGTALGNVISGVWLVVLLFGGRRRIGFSVEGLRDLATGREILRIGGPQVAERTLFAIADIPFNALVLTFGTTANAGFQVGRRMMLFGRIPGVGIGVATGSFVGNNIGRCDLATSERYGFDGAKLSGLVGLVVAGLLFVFAEPVSRLFGGAHEPELLAAMATWVRVYAVSTLMKNVYSAIRYSMQAAGETKLPLYSTGTGILLFMLGFSYLFGIVAGVGLAAVYAGVILDAAVRTAMLGRWWVKRTWHRAIDLPEATGAPALDRAAHGDLGS